MSKSSQSNFPLLISLLITGVMHWLIFLELKREFSVIPQSPQTIDITLLKPLPVPVKKVLPSTSSQAVSAQHETVKKAVVDKAKTHTETVKPAHPKKHRKIQPLIAKAPKIAATKTPEILAQTILPEPIISEPAKEPIIPDVPEPVIEPKVAEPQIIPDEVKAEPVKEPITPNIPKAINEPKVAEPQTVPNETQSTSVLTDKVEEKTPVQEIETTSAQVPIKSSKKSGKSKKHPADSVAEPMPALSLDDLAAQIAQVGEKYATQSANIEENSRKAINSTRKNKVLASQYKRDWRSKIERLANANYPEAARQKDFSARVVIEVGINRDGSLNYARIKKSSGTPELDAAVKDIVQMAAPFAKLPTELAENLSGGVLIISQGMSFHNESVAF